MFTLCWTHGVLCDNNECTKYITMSHITYMYYMLQNPFQDILSAALDESGISGFDFGEDEVEQDANYIQVRTELKSIIYF